MDIRSSDKIPEFNSDGLLPPGDYEITIAELKGSILVAGPQDNKQVPNWDQGWRLWLVENLEILATQLWKVGITDIFVDGSFAEDKEHPNDIDGYFVCDVRDLASGNLEQNLNLLDPQKVWT